MTAFLFDREGVPQQTEFPLGIDAAADFACNNITAGNWLGYMQESSSRNAAYYAVDMIWQKAYENEKGKWGGGY